GAAEEGQVETKKSGSRLAVPTLLRVPTYRFLCLSFPAFGMALWLTYTWLPNFLYEKFSLSLAEAGFTATVYVQSSTLAGLLSGGVIADRLYGRTKAARFWLLSAGMLISAPCIHLLGNSDTLFFTKLAAVGFGFGSGLFIANLMVCSFDIVPADTRASSV